MVHILPADGRAEALKVDVTRLRFLDGFLTELTSSGGYPFCGVCVLRGGTEIFNGAYGVAAPEGAPLQLDTIYPMASVTKPIIATLLAMLQEDGVIDLWEKFNKYYPGFTGGKKDEVEIWQVMAHSSGMSDEAQMEYIIQSVRENGIELPENFTYVDYDAALLKISEKLGLPMTGDYARDCEETQEYLYLKAPLAADPHTAFSYCNHAYSMLAKLIERLTGEDINSYASRRLFLPLGMMDTHFILPKEKWPRVVKREPALQGAEWLNSEFILENTSGAGGLKSTVSDLALFGQMYLNSGRLGTAKILSPASVRLLTADHNAELPASYWGKRWLSSSWGLGWNVCYGKKDDMGLLRSRKAFDHAGLGGARLMIDPEYELVVSMYLVEKEEMAYDNQSRVANIIYSALE